MCKPSIRSARNRRHTKTNPAEAGSVGYSSVSIKSSQPLLSAAGRETNQADSEQHAIHRGVGKVTADPLVDGRAYHIILGRPVETAAWRKIR